ncbi:cytochrome P450 [Streptomyces sp. NPDC018693]|uniref:cytochrome P450 n=1 Tax=unclassified Streptomyces TaxID=2593676 RepID=UPI0037AD520E
MNDASPAAAPVVARHDTDAEAEFYALMQNPANDDPYTGYRRLRELAPALITGDGTVVVTGHAECDAALRHRSLGRGDDMDGFRLAPVPEEQVREVMSVLRRSMAFVDPPRHTRMRKPVSAVFTHRQVEALRPAVTGHVDRLLTALAAEPEADFMAAVAEPLPEIVIADLLGIPEADRAQVVPNSRALAALMEPVTDAQVFADAAAAQKELCAYFAELLALRRAHPQDDLLSRLGAAPEGTGLDDDEIVSTALLLLGAGIKTTTHLLGNGLRALLDHPEELRRLREEPQMVPSAVQELLRYDTPAQLDARVALEPVTFAGIELKPGQTVMTVIGAANRDPARFADPDRLDVARTENGHLSYAAGVHFCLGAQLANLEAEVLLARLPVHCPDPAPAGPAVRRPGLGLRGYERLPVTAGGDTATAGR